MNSPKDAFRIFRAAAWNSDAEMQSFAATSAPSASDLAKLLGVLIDPEAVGESAGHARRVRVFAAFAERTLDPSLFVPYARALRGAEPALRALLVMLLPRVNSVAGHVELCRLLGAPDQETRAAAAKVLTQVAGKVAFDALLELTRDPSFTGHTEALDLMAPKAMHQVAQLAASVIANGRTQDRKHALSLLAEPKYFAQHPAAAIDVAARALGDSDERIVAQAVFVVARYATEEAFRQHTDTLLWSQNAMHAKAVVEALRRYPTTATVAVLTRKMNEGPNPVRIAALETAEAMGGDAVLPIFVEGLSHRELVVRGEALEVVGRLSDAGKLDPARAILWLLRSRDVNQRRIAVEVLNRVGDRKGDLGPRLLRFLKDEDWWVRERTMDALVEIAGPSLTVHLIPYLKDPSANVRRFAVAALRRIGAAAPLAALIQIANVDDDWWVREDAIAAIAAIGDARAIPHLIAIAAAQPDLRLPCIDGLVVLKATAAIEEIAQMTADIDPDVRLAAIRALAAFDDRRQANVLEALTQDPVGSVCKAARETLAKWNLASESMTVRNRISLDELLAATIELDADDLLLHAGRAPYVKVRSQIEVVPGWNPLTSAQIHALVEPHLSPVQTAAFFERGEDIDFSHEMRALGVRFRVNLFKHASGVGAVFRIVKNDALLIFLDNLGLPPVVAGFSDLKDGLVVVAGPTGAGKSTTLAAIVDRINRSSPRHILTIEDPIETLHISERSLITQREVGSHTPSFSSALRAAMREDPDVILVGEMRDRDTVQFAVSAAETGHLVLGTLHAPSAETCVARIINAFPVGQQLQVRAMLAASLRAVVCQNLLRRKNGQGRVAATEIMLNNEAISNLIRKGKEFQISQAITTSRGSGMQLMDHELARLVREGIVDMQEAYARAVDKVAFEGIMTGRPADTGRVSAPPPAMRASFVPPSIIPPATDSKRPPRN